MPRRSTSFFSREARDQARNRVLELAHADERVVAGAVVGSLALGDGDRWSDLDLTFAVRDGIAVEEVLADWTRRFADELDAVHLFDVWGGAALYRVFLLPGCLQLDVSVAPESSFGARTPAFRLLFGTAAELSLAPPPPAGELFGYAVHHALRARFSIERDRPWLAEYWVGQTRDYALALACRRRGLPTSHGRGFDELPADVLARFEPALPRSLDRNELLRALAAAVDGLLREGGELAGPVEDRLRTLA
jgi:hypothetical protein